MSKIQKIWAREILDSRGIPTIESACQLDTGQVAVASVPAGTSLGTYEALELRDKDPARYKGMGVLKAVENINKVLGPALIGKDPTSQIEIDKALIAMDGTENKTKYGANAILCLSQVIAKAGSMANQLSLYTWIMQLSKVSGLEVALHMPSPIFNMINGGLHGAGNLDFQEFHVIPSSTKSYADGLMAGAEIYIAIGENLERKGAIHSVGDEGGYAPNLYSNTDALEVIIESIKSTRYTLGRDIHLGLDVAGTVLFKNGSYRIRDKTSPLDENAFIDFFRALNDQYHLTLLEDPLHEDSWEGWKKLTTGLSDQLMVVGDDLLATNPKRLEKAISMKACNAILVKPNQIGTVSETIEVIKKAKAAGMKVVVSHRSGETNDWFMADFAVGVGANYVKFGAPCRGERVAKYNRLANIETEIVNISTQQ